MKTGFTFFMLLWVYAALAQFPEKILPEGQWKAGSNGFYRHDLLESHSDVKLSPGFILPQLQESYKVEFSSMDVEPFVHSVMPNVFINRFSSPDRDVFTVYNNNFRTVSGCIFRAKEKKDAKFRDVRSDREVKVVDKGDGILELNFEIGMHGISCIVRELSYKFDLLVIYT